MWRIRVHGQRWGGWIGGILGIILLVGAVIWYGAGRVDSGAVRATAIPAASPAAAVPAWDSHTVTQVQSEVLAAVQCRTQQQGLDAVVSDPALSATASEALTRLGQEPTRTPKEEFDQYDWWQMGVILDRTHPSPSGCGWQDFDLAALDLTGVDAVGVAIAPPVGYAPVTVLIIGRRNP